MRLINAQNIATAHEAVVKLLLTEGEELTTEDGELTFEYPEPVAIHIHCPISKHMVSEACMFGPNAMDEYEKQLSVLHPKTPQSATYYYSNRLYDYPEPLDPGYWEGNGNGAGINQINDSIVERLIKNPNSRRAIAITWVPAMDIDSEEPPCIQLVQCFVRDNKLNMVLYIRSNDMLSAWGANAYGFAHMQKKITTAVASERKEPLEIGWLETISASAHMYWKRDAAELKKFRRILNL